METDIGCCTSRKGDVDGVCHWKFVSRVNDVGLLPRDGVIDAGRSRGEASGDAAGDTPDERCPLSPLFFTNMDETRLLLGVRGEGGMLDSGDRIS